MSIGILLYDWLVLTRRAAIFKDGNKLGYGDILKPPGRPKKPTRAITSRTQMKTCGNSLVESPVATLPQPRPKKLIVKIRLVDIRKRSPQFSKHIYAVDRKRPTQIRRLVIPGTRKQPPIHSMRKTEPIDHMPSAINKPRPQQLHNSNLHPSKTTTPQHIHKPTAGFSITSVMPGYATM